MEYNHKDIEKRWQNYWPRSNEERRGEHNESFGRSFISIAKAGKRSPRG